MGMNTGMRGPAGQASGNTLQRLRAALQLGLRFVWAVVVSGVATLRIIVRATLGRGAPEPVLVRMNFAPLTEAGTALLGALITLTPGTTTLDIDMARRELLLHMLDGRDVDGAVAGIRRDFEDALRVLCGTPAEAAPAATGAAAGDKT